MSDNNPQSPKTLAEKLRQQQEQTQRAQVAEYEARMEAFKHDEARKEQQRQERINALVAESLLGIEKALEDGARRNHLYRFAVVAAIPLDVNDQRLKPFAAALKSQGMDVLYVAHNAVFDADLNQVGHASKRNPVVEDGTHIGTELELRVNRASLTGWYGLMMNDHGHVLVVGQWK